MILPHIYDVDISRPLLPTVLQPMLVTGDKLANRIGVRLKNNGADYTPDGSCRGYVLRADGATVPILNGVVNGNEMYIDLPEAAYAVQGAVVISIVCVTSSAVTTVFLGTGSVNRSQSGVVIDPGTVIDDISTLIQTIETAVESIPQDYSTLSGNVSTLMTDVSDLQTADVGIKSALAKNYAYMTFPIAKGEYCLYQGALFKAKQDIPTSESWTAAHWEMAVIGEDVAELKSALDEYKDGFANLNIFGTAELLYEDGYATIDDGHISFKQPRAGLNSYLLPVDGTSVYSFVGCRFAFLLESDKYTAIGSLLQNVTQINSTGASYICFTVNYQTYPLNDYIVSKGDTLQTGFVLPDWFNDAEAEKLDKDQGQANAGKALIVGNNGIVTPAEVNIGVSSVNGETGAVTLNAGNLEYNPNDTNPGGSIGAALGTKIDKNGTGQVKPKNIEGVTVTGGNILADAERLYCSQVGHVGGGGYVTVGSTSGKALISNNDSFCSFLIAVKPNTHYTANNSIRFAVLLKNLNIEGTSLVLYSTVVGSALSDLTAFDTGEADHIIVSWNFSTYPINTFVISEGYTPTTDVEITLPDWWTGGAEIVKPKYISTTGSLSDGTFLALLGYKQNLRKGERYVFSGDLTTMSELHFGFTYGNSFSASSTIYNEFIIDSTYITYKTDGSSTSYTERFEHGLTFANNLQFIFEYLPEGNAKITLLSNGVAFTQTLSFVKKTISQVVVRSVGSTLTNCKLSWTPIDIDKPIWMFGDSYFAYSSERWTYYLQQYGYAQNVLIDGWPGEGSVNARNSLLTLIQFGTPKYVVWCMGMNDGSDADASTPSTSWETYRDEMLSVCEGNGITPILATIPNVPSILHTGKNAWIKASGYRYIDFAAAVGAEAAGATWFSGMLEANSDPSKRVHPTETGAKALFARSLVDFPEIMLNE